MIIIDYCSARLERKDICVETTKEKIDEYINGANVTRILQVNRNKKKDRAFSIQHRKRD